MRLHELFFRSVVRYTDNVAIIVNGFDVQTINYFDLGEIVHKLSSCFRRLFARNEVVGVCSSQHMSLAAVLLAVNDASAAFLPISVPVRPRTLWKILERHSIHYILVESVLSEEIERGNQNLASFSHADKDILEELQQLNFRLYEIIHNEKCIVRWNEDLAYVVHTSGTTGEPKAVFVPHSCIVPNIIHLSSIFDVTSHDVVFLASPYTFDPFIVQMFLAFNNGAALLIVPDITKMQPEMLCEKLFDQHKVTILQLTPSVLYYIGPKLISEKILPEDSCVSVLALGGESFPAFMTLRRWKHPGNRTKLFNIYGITEVSSWASCYEICDNDLIENITEVKVELRNRCPLGSLLSQTELVVYDDFGRVVNGDGVGHLWIGGHYRQCLLEGESEDSIPVLRDSGDLVEVWNGQMWYLGRSDNHFKRFGQLVNLEYVEKVVQEASDGQPCSLVLEPVGVDRKIMHLFIVQKDIMNSSVRRFKSELKERVQEVLPRAAQPDEIHVILKLPLTEHGKVNKMELLRSLDDMELEGQSDESVAVALSRMWLQCCQSSDLCRIKTDAEAPKNSEAKTTKTSEKVCQQSESTSPKPDEVFILHGGDSFAAVHLSNLIQRWSRKRLKTRLELSMLVDVVINRSFGELVKFVEKQARETKLPYEFETCPNYPNFGSPAKKLKTDNDGQTFLDASCSAVLAKHPESLKTGLVSAKNETCKCVARRGNERVVCLSCKDNSKCMLTRTFIPPNCTDEKFCPVDISVQWKTSFDKCVDASPLVLPSCLLDDGLVFIGSHSHLFMSVFLSNGVVKWKTQLGDRIESSSCLSLCGKRIVVGCYDSKIYVLEKSDGKITWTYQTGGVVKSSPRLDKQTGLIWIGSYDSFLYALDVEHRLCPIRVDCVEGSCFSSPCVCYLPHQVYIGTLAGRFLAVNAVTGEVLWCKNFSKPIFASPLIGSSSVYIATVDGCLRCFDHGGSHLWVFSTAGTIFSSPVLCSSGNELTTELVVGSHDHHVYCITTVGKCRWSTEVDGPVYSTPTSVGGIAGFPTAIDEGLADADSYCRVVIVITTKGTLYQLDMRSGHVLKTFAFPGNVFSSPVVVGQNVVVGCRDDCLYCLKFT